MRLKFYLLCFEDSEDWINSKIEHIKDVVEERGFELVPPKICKNEEEFKGDYRDYDMILMDYDLTSGSADGKTGANIIKSIRSQKCLTTILFYSQNGETKLRQEIAREFLDGVFCAHREDFIEKFEKLFTTNIKKIEDVNNLRGLVMAETSDIEEITEEVINLYDSISCPKKKEITKAIVSDTKKFHINRKKLLESKNDTTPFNEILKLLDLSKKSIIIHKINSRNTAVCDFIHKDFDEKIIQKRNLLAHVKEKIIKYGKIKKTILKSGKNGKKLIFSQDEAKQIRKDILKYKQELEKLRNSLKTISQSSATSQ